MQLILELLELEEGFWREGAEYYRQNLIEEALLVMPAPVGVLDKAETLEAIEANDRWANVRIENPRLLRLAKTTAALVYEARAYREGAFQPYVTMVSSVYVLEAGSWKLYLHQQSPSTTVSG